MHNDASQNPFAVIFDMDGVLIDSIKLNWKAINQALAVHNIVVNDVDISQYLGKTLEDQLKQINDTFHTRLSYARFAVDVSQIKNTLIDGLSPKPGVLKLLKDLKKAHISFTVATSTAKALAKHYLEVTGLLAYFDIDAIIAAEDVSRHKPEPEVYIKAAKVLGFSPTACAVFEDAPAGIQAAKAANMSCIALDTIYVSDEDLQIADLVVPSLEAVDLSVIQAVISNSRK